MSQPEALLNRFPALARLSALPKPLLMGAAAALVAVIAVALLWSRAPDYSVLFSNLEDRDGGAIVTALTQMNVPYQFSANGTAILVPADRVHETRLTLAGQGLPRGGGVGFELLDNTRFGASQFTEQITFQRALEGELASSIQAVHAVQMARVHLAIPRESLFVRERQAPTASVLLSLYAGRSLTPAQVSAITWLVSSSVPNLSADNVSVVDQHGRLLTPPTGQAGVDGTQRNFINDIEQRTVQRIMTLLSPLVGPGNVHAQASADVDFSQREQTSEVYRPNQAPGEAAVRSAQVSDSEQHNILPPQGVPGALTNQPPGNVVAPITAPVPAGPAAPAGAANVPPSGTASSTVSQPGNTRHDSTINYEVDRTISHIKDPVGKLHRLSVAVVINYQSDENGTPTPLPPEEMEKLTLLVKDAMGFSNERGDTVSVINSEFAPNATPEIAVWQNPAYLDLAQQALRYLLIAVGLFLLWSKLLKPFVNSLLAHQSRVQAVEVDNAAAAADAAAAARRATEISRYEDNLSIAQGLAGKDPRAVAMVIRSWMEKNGKS